jgi:hypothetical protein
MTKHSKAITKSTTNTQYLNIHYQAIESVIGVKRKLNRIGRDRGRFRLNFLNIRRANISHSLESTI